MSAHTDSQDLTAAAAPSRSRWFTFLLDGIGDAITGKHITQCVAVELGLRSRCDPAGMTLEVESEENTERWTEESAERVSAVCRRWGLEPRDRVGTSFVSTIGADELRARLQHEWTSRLATGLVFLLPAILLHYLKPVLAGTTTYVPNGIEAILVGWAMIACAWPVLYQGLLGFAALRMTPDLFQSVLLLGAFVVGLIQTVRGAAETSFIVTSYALLSISLQRTVVWRGAVSRAGKAHLMIPGSPLLLVILVGAVAVAWFDWTGACAMMLATPAMMGLLFIVRVGQPLALAVSVLMFAALMALAPAFLEARVTVWRVESVFIFVILLTTWCAKFAPREPVSD